MAMCVRGEGVYIQCFSCCGRTWCWCVHTSMCGGGEGAMQLNMAKAHLLSFPWWTVTVLVITSN